MVEPGPDINPDFLFYVGMAGLCLAISRTKTIQRGGMISKGMAGRAPKDIRWLLFPFGLAALVSAARGA
jgi:hypothetical protein